MTTILTSSVSAFIYSNSASSLSVSMSSLNSNNSPSSSFLPLYNSTAVPTNKPDCSSDDEVLRWPLAVLYSLFFLFGLVGNLFALWVFLFIRASHNSVRVFLINCAVADLVLLAFLPFRIFYHVNGNKWALGSVACKAVGNLFYMNMYISIALLGLISLDRYLRLKGKGKARRGMIIRLCGHSWPWGSVACGVLWGFSLMAVIPMITTAEDKEDNNKCFHYKQRTTAKGKAYFNGVLVLMFWFIFFMMVASYARVAVQLLKVSRDKPDLPNAQRYQRTAKKSFFILFLFTVCFAPYHAFRPIYILSQLNEQIPCDYQRLVDRTNEVMLLFSAFNSCLDPVMYFLLSGSVRKTALRTLGDRFGPRLRSLNDATSNSSTMDFRRMSAPNPDVNHSSNMPQSSISVINSTLRLAAVTTLPPTGQI